MNLLQEEYRHPLYTFGFALKLGTRTLKIEAKCFKMQSIFILAMLNRGQETISVKLFNMQYANFIIFFLLSMSVKAYFSILK